MVSEETVLLGEGSMIDSFGLVTLILAFENAIEVRTGELVELADDRALSRRNSPFRTLGTLATYAIECLNDQS